MNSIRALCSSIIVILLAAAVSAQTVIIPSAVTATSSHTSYPIDNVRNGVGMVNTAGDVSTWTHNDDNVGNWLGAIAGGQTLIFTLPSASTVGSLHAWQYDRNNSWNSRAIKTFNISFSTDGGGTYPTTLTGLSLEMEPETGTVTPVQTVDFAQQLNVTHIKLDLTANWGDGSWYALGEMYFGEGTAGAVAPTLGSLVEENITETSVDLLATLGGADADVTVFWDTEPKGQNFTWAHSNVFPGVVLGTVISNHVSGLTAGQTNYYAFYATNAGGTAWEFASFQTTPQIPVIQPFSVSNPSFLNSSSSADYLVDGSGLVPGSGDVLTNFHEVATQTDSKHWMSMGGNPGTNTFTLPGTADVDGIYVWQYNRSGNVPRQVVSFSLAFSDDGGATYPTTISGLTLDTNAGGVTVLPQTVLFDRQDNVTHVKMLEMVNGGDSYTGLCEVRLKRADPAPPQQGTVVTIR